MRTEYHKLVRDRIPEIILGEGRTCAVETMTEDDYVMALKEKLVEEAREAAGATDADLVKELADLLEVIDSLMAATTIAPDRVRAVQARRRAERGGFRKMIRLLWTE